jgi:hypothetical protein
MNPTVIRKKYFDSNFISRSVKHTCHMSSILYIKIWGENEAGKPGISFKPRATALEEGVAIILAVSRRAKAPALFRSGGHPACRRAGRPARRRKRPLAPTVLENFGTVLGFHRSSRAAGRQPSTADETSATTAPSPLFRTLRGIRTPKRKTRPGLLPAPLVIFATVTDRRYNY